MRWSSGSRALFVALAFLAASAAPALGATEITPQEKKLIPLAKKEGGFTFINANLLDPTMRRMRAAFLKHYGMGDDFKFNFVLKGTGPTVATARQEIKWRMMASGQGSGLHQRRPGTIRSPFRHPMR